MDRIEHFKLQMGIIFIAEFLITVLLFLLGVPVMTVLFLGGVILFNIFLVGWTMIRFDLDKKNREFKLEEVLEKDMNDAMTFGEVAVIEYDEFYQVTWCSDLLAERGFNYIGKKLFSWNAHINELFIGDVDEILIEDGEYTYLVSRKENSYALYLKDVTELNEVKTNYKNERIILGMIQLDNYLEISQYENETMVSKMNMNLRQPIIDWAKENGIVIRRIRADRFYVVFNELTYAQILKDKFEILNTIRDNAKEIGINVTMSMALARGKGTLADLDAQVIELMELTQSRGGDQVAVKLDDQSVKYYGGNSEAQEKRSRVRVRVMTIAIRDAILEADRVFIVGHKNMDFDCVGSSIAVSRICTAYQKECYIVSESGGIEEQCQDALNGFSQTLKARHNFITETEAVKLHKKNDLIIAVDFHNPDHCNAPALLERADKIIVIDHHRRSEAFINNPLLVYSETSASSVCELVTEFIPYSSSMLDISEEEAMIMYLGILIDTNHFKTRTGSRTFEAAATLRQLGVDPNKAEDLIKENYEEYEIKAEISSFSKKISDDMIVCAVEKDKIFSRTMMSKVADSLLKIKGIEASFVVCYSAENTVAISARSKGNVNVQLIMEAMKGGGHFTGAAMVRENTTVTDIEAELLSVIRHENKGVNEDESNLTD